MDDLHDPKKLVPNPPPRWQNGKGVLIPAAVLLLATGAVIGWWIIFG
jgi:hypothetical protein